MWEKRKFVGQLVMGQLNVQLSVHGRKKKTPLVPSNSSGYLQLPPPSHINHSLYIPIYTYSSLSSLQVSLCSAEEKGKRRRSSADERKRQNCCLWAEGEEGAEVEWPLWWRGKEARYCGFHQEETAGSGLLISLEEQRVTNRTNSFCASWWRTCLLYCHQ